MNSLLLFLELLSFRKTRALGPLILLFMFTYLLGPAKGASPVCVSGVYPSLTMYNEEGECGTGAVVPWADRLWVITYAPHKPEGWIHR